MKKSIIFLAVGIICAIAALFVTKAYLEKQKQEIATKAEEQIKSAKENQASVMVARVDIPAGATISDANLEVAIVPNNYLQPKAASSLSRIDGMVASVPISKGSQITMDVLSAAKVQAAQAAAPRGLSAVTPPGKRAVTLSVDNLSSSLGMVKAGDFVDIFAMMSLPEKKPGSKEKAVDKPAVVPMFQSVLVLATNNEIVAQAPKAEKAKDGPPESRAFITVALSPKDANLLMFVQEQGKIRLVLRSPRDTQMEAVEPANLDTLMRYINPKYGQEDMEKPKEKEAPFGYVEIYRGLSKERVPIAR